MDGSFFIAVNASHIDAMIHPVSFQDTFSDTFLSVDSASSPFCLLLILADSPFALISIKIDIGFFYHFLKRIRS